IDIRVVSATNHDLEQMVQARTFREDLFYRLNVIPLTIPPLRERRDDIPLLVNHFLERFNQKLQKEIRGVDPQALDLLLSYHWPGNVRELENAMEYGVSLEQTDVIRPESLPPRIRHQGDESWDLRAMVREYEKKIIEEALAQFANGEKAVQGREKAARHLHIGIATLYRKMREYGIQA
ncbi:MAG TPA: sigma 54-interacting transcriptional regulator, partial [Firmicutes bacterium]|nr:sigma 54-interacting transcriptional regulator [Bacillota bacterium]